MRRTAKRHNVVKPKRTRHIKRRNRKTLRRRTYRKGGLGSARQAFTQRFIQTATQTGKKLGSELGKEIAGKLTKATLQDENSGDLVEKSKRIVKKAFNVRTPAQLAVNTPPRIPTTTPFMPTANISSLRKLR